MNKTKEWEQVWLDGQTYYWTSLADWSEFAGESVNDMNKDAAYINNANNEWWEQGAAVPPVEGSDE